MQRFKGISIVADSMMKDIVEIHERAQALGSTYHDISKLKMADFLVTGVIEGKSLGLRGIDVNAGTEIFQKTIDISASNSYAIKSACTVLYDSILFSASARTTEVSVGASPYVSIIESFVASLKSADEDIYKYLALYSRGQYRRPVKEDKALDGMAKSFLRATRPAHTGVRLSFLYLEEESPWTNLFMVSDKRGMKQKHKFGIIERDDGTPGIAIYELLR
ncbi:MAG: hypothetical protein JXA20_18480 [Spirochaetes bacterium]|nr:hypothetical protein [Spirochaetota bacterium]